MAMAVSIQQQLADVEKKEYFKTDDKVVFDDSFDDFKQNWRYTAAYIEGLGEEVQREITRKFIKVISKEAKKLHTQLLEELNDL